MIKKIMLGVTLVGLLVCALFVEGHCVREGRVISNDNGFARIEDKAGDIWEYDNLTIVEGSNVRMIFDTNGTDHDKTDDKIISIKRVDK